MSATARDSVLGRINALLAEVENEKVASEMDMSGSGAKDPGGYVSPSSHPSAKKDDRSGPADLGSRGKENEKDVKEVYPAAVDNTAPGSGGTQDDKAYNIGTHVSATGEDPKTEDNYKGDKDDPGTSHPANMEDSSEKYSSMRTDLLMKEAFNHLNTLLAEIATSGNNYAVDVEPSQFKSASDAAQAGYELSSQLLNSQSYSMDKAAAAQVIVETTIREALQDADNVGQYLMARQQIVADQVKAANEMPPEAMMDPSMAGGAPPMAPEAGPAPGDVAGMPGGDMPPEAGGMGDGDGDENAVAELVRALEELGIDPEELLAAAHGAGGGHEAAGGVDPDAMGGEEPKIASASIPLVNHMSSSLCKYAEDAKALYVLSNEALRLVNTKGVKVKTAKQGSRTRAERDEIKAYITEVCGLR